MGIISSLKKLNLNISDLEEIISDHSIAAVTDPEGNIVSVNQKFCDISKYSEEELIGQNHRILKSDEHPPEFYTKLWDSISNGEVWKGEIKNRAKDGSYFWVKTTIVPIIDSNEKITHYVALRTDITKEKETQAQLLKMEQQLISKNEQLLSEVKNKTENLVKSERLATIGTMASRIAHDLKNPLTIIHTYSEMLTPDILSNLDSKGKEKWIRMQSSILDMNRIVEDVLDFAKTSEIKKSQNSLIRLMKLALNHVDTSYGVRINFPDNDVTVSCDPRKMEGVFSNLFSNAVEAVNGNGEIDISVSSDSEFVLIQVKDSGPGIPDVDVDKIFEPMFTTKSTGTGLGLLICKSIVEQHGGTISVSNKPTTFTIKLPL